MKFLQVGLGSMGKRRIRCLHALGERDILAFDTREDRRAEAADLYGVETTDDAEGMWHTPGLGAVLVSTPPDLHYPYVKGALDHGLHSFCEAGVVSEGAEEILALSASKGVVAAPSATMRFHPVYQRLHRLVTTERALGRPLAMTFHLGNYILDWHPWEGLDFYAGRKATGAGREMVPFEFEWMRWVLGEVVDVQCTYGRQLDLPTDIDDTYAIVATFESGLIATILIEVVARSAVREGRIVSQAGTIEWDVRRNLLRHYDAATAAWQQDESLSPDYDAEQMYVAEVAAWLSACRGEATWEHDWSQDQALWRVLRACELSHETGRRVRVAEVDA